MGAAGLRLRPEGFQNAGSARERSAVARASLAAPARACVICRFTRARDYQIVLGFASHWLPAQTKALALAVLGVRR
jgi:hypothetical protein